MRKRLPGYLLMLMPATLFACWQIGQKPTVIANTEIGGIFTYEHKPLRAALRLEDASGKLIANAETDADGRFTFSRLAPGKYRIQMVKPSFEKVEINLVPASLLYKRTALRVNYYADWCQEVAVVQGSR